MSEKRKSETTTYYAFNYATLFGAYMIMFALVVYAPLIVAAVGGLGIIFLGATFLSKKQVEMVRQNNPFLAAKELGKMMVGTFLPGNRVRFFFADRNIGRDSVSFKLWDGKNWKKIESSLSPEQEFVSEFDGIKLEDDKTTIWDIVGNPKIVWDLKDHKKQIWNIEPLNIQSVFMVFPESVLGKTQLKAWNLQEDENATAKTEPILDERGQRQYDPKTNQLLVKKIPVFSPVSYAIDVDGVRKLSATHRYSEVSSSLQTARDLLGGAENVAAGAMPRGRKSGGFGGVIDFIKSNPIILIVILLLGALIFGLKFLGGGVANFGQNIAAGAAEVAKNSGVTKFP